MLIARTLRSATFRAALLSIACFGAIVVGLFAFVYWSTSSYLFDRIDRSINRDRGVLLAAYVAGGRSELTTVIKMLGDQHPDHGVFLLADATFALLAGNRKEWPIQLKGTESVNASVDKLDWDAADGTSVRAIFDTLSDGSHLLVGREVTDFTRFARRIYLAFALVLVLILALAMSAALATTRRTVGRIESINATSRAIMQSGPGLRVPTRGSHDEWDQLAENLNSMLDRIALLLDEVKQATDNVAHDLRTPLTRMRARLERAI